MGGVAKTGKRYFSKTRKRSKASRSQIKRFAAKLIASSSTSEEFEFSEKVLDMEHIWTNIEEMEYNSGTGEPDIAPALELLPEQTELPNLRPRRVKGSKDDRIYCRLCLKPAYKNSLTPLSVVDFNYPGKSETFKKKKLEKVEEINKMLKFCLPFYDSLTFNPVICSICLGRLKVCYEFSKECLKSQRLVEKYADMFGTTERVINLNLMIEAKFELSDDENMSDNMETEVSHIPKVTTSGRVSQKRKYSYEDSPPTKKLKEFDESHEEDSLTSSNDDTSNIKIEPDDDDGGVANYTLTEPLKMEPDEDDNSVSTERLIHDVPQRYIIDPIKIDEETMIKVEPNYIDCPEFIKNEPVDDSHEENKVFTEVTDTGTDIDRRQPPHFHGAENVSLDTINAPLFANRPVLPNVRSSLTDTTSDVIK